MKKTCKILSIILIILMLLINISYAVEEDTEAPVINSITMSTKNVKAGEDIIFSVNTTDNLSGTFMIGITWKLEGTDGQNQNCLQMQLGDGAGDKLSSDVFERSFTIPETTLSGNWQVSFLSLHDAAGNSKYIDRSNTEEFDISTLDFTVEENNNIVDTEAPKLNSIRIVEANYEVPGTVIIEAEITDNVSETVTAYLNYVTKLPEQTDGLNAIKHIMSWTMTKQSSGKYQAKITLDNQYLNLIMVEIVLYDENRNFAGYTYHEEVLNIQRS